MSFEVQHNLSSSSGREPSFLWLNTKWSRWLAFWVCVAWKSIYVWILDLHTYTQHYEMLISWKAFGNSRFSFPRSSAPCRACSFYWVKEQCDPLPVVKSPCHALCHPFHWSPDSLFPPLCFPLHPYTFPLFPLLCRSVKLNVYTKIM